MIWLAYNVFELPVASIKISYNPGVSGQLILFEKSPVLIFIVRNNSELAAIPSLGAN